jgi:hypothetical protein
MAIWAEETQVFFSIVKPVAADVIDVQCQRPTLPDTFDLTARAAVWHPDCDQAPSELSGAGAGTAFWQRDENLFWSTALWRGLTLVRGDPVEMGGVDPEALQLAADVCVVAARDGDAEMAEDVGDAEGDGRRRGQHFGGVFVFDGHAPRLCNGTDNSWGMRRPY